MVVWRRTSEKHLSRAKSGKYLNVLPEDIVFEIQYGFKDQFCDTRPKLLLMNKKEGQRYSKNVIASKHILSSNSGKEIVDAFMTILYYSDRTPEEGLQWVLSQFDIIEEYEPVEFYKIPSASHYSHYY